MCSVDAVKPRVLSLKTVRSRVDQGELLVIIKYKVYNLTKWAPHHPGGELILKHLAGLT
jgi:cytochrome b involved in lipid metabolism